MKCVKKNDEIKRVSNEHAEELVNKGWAFVAKKEWKIVRDANKKMVGVEQIMETVSFKMDTTKSKKVPGKKHAYREELRKKRSQM